MRRARGEVDVEEPAASDLGRQLPHPPLGDSLRDLALGIEYNAVITHFNTRFKHITCK